MVSAKRPGSSMLAMDVRISDGIFVQFDVLIKLLHHRTTQKLPPQSIGGQQVVW